MAPRAVAALALLCAAAPAAEWSSIGLTSGGRPIRALAVEGAAPDAPRVVVVAGLDGDETAVKLVERETREYAKNRASRRRFHLTAVPLANPEKARLVFPPPGAAYRENAEAHYLWRWLGTAAPDLVIVAGGSDAGLAAALSSHSVAGYGKIPAVVSPARPGFLRTVKLPPHRSEARLELERRLSRTPAQTARELAEVYGRDFKDAVYIPAMALIGQLRLGRVGDVERLAAPFAGGELDSLAKPTGSHLAGHLLFGELAERTGKSVYTALVRRAAELGFDRRGVMLEAMPLHLEMSDAVFMGCPILAKAGKLTGERKYFAMALRHLRFIQNLCLRPDGLYRHSPLADAAWGRGNAFPALGLALALSDIPPEDEAFDPVLRSFQHHMSALAQWQQDNGMWRQVIDYDGAYAEYSATAMIAAAMLRGIRSGWLDAKSYQPRVERAWRAVLARTGSDGKLVDVCEGTGKQKTLEDYLRRAAILGQDARGGGMALFLATELAAAPFPDAAGTRATRSADSGDK